jgi:2-C-methyl-D-erythritol 2,4-cyclodiphosphate synthase
MARRISTGSGLACRVRRRSRHVDAYITLGTTRLAPHLDAMRANLSCALAVPVERVSVKARTNDGLGPDGEGRAASANVVVLLAQSS